MAREKMLLDRIGEGGESTPGRPMPTTHENVEALLDSVRGNLSRLLASRHGMSESASDYGLPALNDLSMSTTDYVQRLQEAIRSTIETYEPRLRRVVVTPQVDESGKPRLSFRIDAVLVGRSGEHRIYYLSDLTGEGTFSVTG